MEDEGRDDLQGQKPEDNLSTRKLAPEEVHAMLLRDRREAALPSDLAENYEIIGEIARGGMGVVYKAKQKTPSRIVALKVMLQGALASEQERKRFLHEADAAARLKHAGIVPIYEVGESQGSYYFTMEYVEGQTLGTYLETHELDLKAKLDLFQRICEIVTHAHIQGVIHRDLKPGNIMIDKDGNPRILDFGLAKMTEMGPDEHRSFVTMSGVVVGTLAYMSPEQTLGKPEEIDTRSDVYSLGVILYQMLTGAMPYPVDIPDPIETIRNIREREPKRPSTIMRILRDDLETIILKAIAKEKERRYQSAADFARDISHYLHNEPIEAKPASAWYKFRKTVQRHKAASAATAIVVLGFLVAFVLVNAARREAERERDRADKAASAETEQRKVAEDAGRREKQQRVTAEKARGAEEAQRKVAQQQRDNAIRESYYAKLTLASQRIQGLEFSLAEELLDTCPMQSRNWEWGRLKYLCNLDLLTLRGHTQSISAVAFSPSGEQIASSSGDGTVRIWDMQTGLQVLALRGHVGAVRDVVFAPDGKRIVSGGADKTVRIWDTQTGQELFTLRGHGGAVNAIALNVDGSKLASGSTDRTVKVWSMRSTQEILTIQDHVDGVGDVVFSLDGKRIAWSSGGTTKVSDAGTGEDLLAVKLNKVSVACLAFSPDGRLVASGDHDGLVKVWDSSTGREMSTLDGHQNNVVWSVAFSPNGSHLASASWDRKVKIWDIASGKDVLTLTGHSHSVNAVAFSPDGRFVASGSKDRSVKIWDAERTRELLRLDGDPYIQCFAFSPDGEWIASGCHHDTIEIWDTQAKRKEKILRGESPLDVIGSVSFSPDGRLLASASPAHEQKTYNQDGKQTACSSDKPSVRIWDLETGRALLQLEGHSSFIEKIVFSPDGKKMASASQDRTVKIWDVGTGEETLTLKGHVKYVNDVKFAPDGKRIASASGDTTIKIWDANRARETISLKGHSEGVSSIDFSPDGELIVSGSLDHTVKVWDSRDGKILLTLHGHSGAVLSVAFSPDGTRIASASLDETVKIWDARTGQELLTDTGHNYLPGCAVFHPNGKVIASVYQRAIFLHPALGWTRTPQELEQEKLERWREMWKKSKEQKK